MAAPSARPISVPAVPRKLSAKVAVSVAPTWPMMCDVLGRGTSSGPSSFSSRSAADDGVVLEMNLHSFLGTGEGRKARPDTMR
jgi:hypothetical protein